MRVRVHSKSGSVQESWEGKGHVSLYPTFPQRKANAKLAFSQLVQTLRLMSGSSVPDINVPISPLSVFPCSCS